MGRARGGAWSNRARDFITCKGQDKGVQRAFSVGFSLAVNSGAAMHLWTLFAYVELYQSNTRCYAKCTCLCFTRKGRTKQPCPRSMESPGSTATISMAMLAPSTSSKAFRT